MKPSKSDMKSLDRLIEIVAELRVKCPWDRDQTFESLRKLTIEEVYELSEAILQGNAEEIKKELGDLLLHVLLYSQIGKDEGLFDLFQVAVVLSEKLIVRHPHVYGDKSAETKEEIQKNWEAVKISKEGNKSVLSGIPSAMPSFNKALRIQDKVASIGFDFKCAEQALEKIKEELEEVEQTKSPQQLEEELGDLIFSCINYARKQGIDPEKALEATNKKFIKRFQNMESKSEQPLHMLDIESLESLWEKEKD